MARIAAAVTEQAFLPNEFVFSVNDVDAEYVHTPAGTRSAVFRIPLRSDANSEIVLVATDATGRVLRPVASVLDTITTLSM